MNLPGRYTHTVYIVTTKGYKNTNAPPRPFGVCGGGGQHYIVIILSLKMVDCFKNCSDIYSGWRRRLGTLTDIGFTGMIGSDLNADQKRIG